VILGALGVGAGAVGFLGGSARFAAVMTPYRPFFVLATVAFLGLGFYNVYKRKEVCDGSCTKDRLKKTKLLLWVISIISLLLVLFPYLLAIR